MKKPSKEELQRESVIWMLHELEMFILQPTKTRLDMKRMAQTFINVITELKK
jgi:hypothetical protein